MATRWFRRTAVCLALLTEAMPARADRDPLDAEVVSTTGGALDRIVRETPGFSGIVLVIRGNDVVLHRAYGFADAAGKRPMTIATRVNVASVSKAITSAAILKLVERDALGLTDPISRFFPDAPRDKTRITITQLLSHTSGYGQGYTGEGVTDRTEAAKALLSRPLEREPGAAFCYSNDNYGLLAIIVELASKRPFDEFVRSEIFGAAGMSDSDLWGHVDPTTDPNSAPPREALPPEVLRPNWGYRGSMGVLTTPRDLVRFFRALREARLVAPASRDLLFAPATPVSVGKAGFGWFASVSASAGPTLWTRGNESWGPNALLTWYRERDTVVVVTSNAGEITTADGPVAHSRALGAALEAKLFAPEKR